MAEALAGAVSELLEAPLLTLTASEICAELREDFACVQQLSARILALVHQASVLGVPAAQAASSTRVWLAETLGMSVRQASAMARLAERLPGVPAVAEALAAGTVNVEQAQVICSTVADLPSEVGAQGKAKAAAVLTGIAVQDRVRPEVLARHREMIMDLVAPEKAEQRLRRRLEGEERSAFRRRGLTLTSDGEGGFRLRGLLDTESAAIVRAALDPLSGPGSLRDWLHPNAEGQPAGPAGPAGRGGADGPGPVGNPDAGGSRNAGGSGGAGPVGNPDAGGSGGAGTASGLESAGDAGGSGGAGTAGGPGGADDAGGPGDADAVADADADAERVRDTRTAAARRADALTFLCQRALDDGDLPESGGERPQLVVTMRWEDLRDQVGYGLLETGELLSPETVRRLACDARIIPAVLGGAGQVLDVGRARRLIDGPLRRALVLRDRGCAWPGCDRPPRWCHGHHVVPWQDGGVTSLASSVLLCGLHHREIHKGQWTVRVAADGHPEFRPPPHLDPMQRWRRNTLHRKA